MIDQKQHENVDYSNCLAGKTTSDSRWTRDIKFRISMGKSAFNKKNNPVHQEIGLKFHEEAGKVLQLEYSFLWC